MSWRPNASLEILELRATLNKMIRDFFFERKVLEVETPVLSVAGVTAPYIESWVADYQGAGSCPEMQRWLRTSPEYALKRLLASGVGDCYELARVFRSGEIGRKHNPEFTLLEWYRVNWSYHQLVDEVLEFVQKALSLVDLTMMSVKYSYQQLFEQYAQVDPFLCSEAQLKSVLSNTEIKPEGLDRDDWLNLVLTHHIEPQFPPQQVTVVYDYPVSQAALSRIRRDGMPCAERFEVYIGPIELANGYHELCDAQEQRMRFIEDLNKRRSQGSRSVPIDEHFLQALNSGLPVCSGVALGMDRLLMAMTGALRIDDVLSFSFLRS